MVTGMGNLSSIVKMLPGAPPPPAPRRRRWGEPLPVGRTRSAVAELHREPPACASSCLSRSFSRSCPTHPGMNKVNEKQVAEVERKYACFESMIQSMTKKARLVG